MEQNNNLTALEKKIRVLHDTLTDMADKKAFDELIKMISKPGFPQPSKSTLLCGLLDLMIEHAKTLAGLRQMLLSETAEVELNHRLF